jgi:hypothetical protein
MMFTMRAMNSYPSAQPLGFFNVELRCTGRWRNAAAIGLINLGYDLARYESRFRIGAATNRRLENEDQNQKRPKPANHGR